MKTIQRSLGCERLAFRERVDLCYALEVIVDNQTVLLDENQWGLAESDEHFAKIIKTHLHLDKLPS